MKRNFLPDIEYKEMFFTCIVVSIFLTVVIFFLQESLPPVVPLLYGLPSGKEQLVPRLFIGLPLVVSSLVAIINLSLSRLTKDIFLKKIFVGLTVATTILATITTIKIFFLVGSI